MYTMGVDWAVRLLDSTEEAKTLTSQSIYF